MAKGQYKDWIEGDGLERVGYWAAQGCTDAELAANMGVSRKTLYVWMGKYPTLLETVKSSRVAACKEVEASLFKRCTGYTAQVKKHYKVRRESYDDRGRKVVNEEMVECVDEVHVPADTKAQIFWLTNRLPDRWKSRVEVRDAGAEAESYEEFLARAGETAEKESPSHGAERRDSPL